jgi:hypothetical protein
MVKDRENANLFGNMRNAFIFVLTEVIKYANFVFISWKRLAIVPLIGRTGSPLRERIHE